MIARRIERKPTGGQATPGTHELLQERAPRHLLVGTGDDVARGLVILVEAEDLLATRQDGLAGRQLEPALAAVSAQLVGNVEAGRVLRHSHAGADTKACDGRIPRHDLADPILVEAATCEDLDALEAGLIQDRPRLEGKLRKLARIEPDRADLEGIPELARERYDVANTPERIVGVHQKDRFRIEPGEMPECRRLVLDGLNVAVRHGAGDRHAV